MNTPYCPEHYTRLRDLLSRPDPPDLPRRSHTLTQEGEADRFATRGLPLLMSWYQHRLQERRGEL